jgi:hypothetical protein
MKDPAVALIPHHPVLLVQLAPPLSHLHLHPLQFHQNLDLTLDQTNSKINTHYPASTASNAFLKLFKSGSIVPIVKGDYSHHHPPQ